MVLRTALGGMVLVGLAIALAGIGPAPVADAVTYPASSGLPGAVVAVSATPPVELPPVNGQFDYQIGGSYVPAESVAIVSRDRRETPVDGLYNICYINAFQTQPSEASFWKNRHRSLLLNNSKGRAITDPDWPGEYILDTSTNAKRKSIAKIVNGWIDGCRAKGYQAIEPDNLDSWTRSGKKLNQTKNLLLAARLTTHAHDVGLAIAQKNAADIGSKGKATAKFDFAIAEECQVYSECGAYTGPYGDNVIEIEYTDNHRNAFTTACAAQGATISVILRDRDVVASNRSAYRYEYC